ncbi:MAG: hypothetical protein K8U57_08335 [Planctomycetes bacterium]|nr:hypothetical protein [Planctomycetota bacterium]
MTPSRLLLLFLVLLQSGLAAGHAHDHVCSANREFHPDSPHVHAHQLLDFLALDTDDQRSEDSEEHESDAFEVSALTTPGPQSSPEVTAADLPEITVPGTVAASTVAAPFLIGLPPSIAGPPRPLYLTFCNFRN